MGIKMEDAFYSIKNDDISIDYATENSIKEHLYCVTPNCRIPISYRRASIRKVNDKDSIVKAHFMRKGTKEHDENCKFNTLGFVKVTARDSDGILTSIGDGMYNFRLNLITSALRSPKSINLNGAARPDLVQPTKQATKKYENKGKIDPYLSTMHKILKLRTEIEDNKELSNIIKLKYNGQEIPWKNFYFERDDYRRCFTYLEKNKIEHPICLEGKIKEIKEPNEKFDYYSVKLTSIWIEDTDRDGVKRIPSVSVNVYNKKVGEYIQSEYVKGKRDLAFYSSLQTRAGVFDQDTTYLNIIGYINHKQQIQFL
ncbi:hypothetical protein [Jeotgalibacillus aurantiacus]|uniref:hypothetical protein n=1 Tax=Jeotgalibacillus aurantiacus TaxID=2763266 RepID=UPI001D0AA10C|nr:hypothetical protein [Jeotgalibacillus aurantiacus]